MQLRGRWQRRRWRRRGHQRGGGGGLRSWRGRRRRRGGGRKVGARERAAGSGSSRLVCPRTPWWWSWWWCCSWWRSWRYQPWQKRQQSRKVVRGRKGKTSWNRVTSSHPPACKYHTHLLTMSFCPDILLAKAKTSPTNTKTRWKGNIAPNKRPKETCLTSDVHTEMSNWTFLGMQFIVNPFCCFQPFLLLY